MKWDLFPSDTWEFVNEQLARDLGLPEGVTVRCARGLGAAVFEVVKGLSSFLPHKRKAGMVRGWGEEFLFMQPYLLQDGFQLENWQGLAEWNSAGDLSADLSFVMWSEDQKITGEISGMTTGAAEKISSKKIFSVSVSHANWIQNFVSGAPKFQPYEIRILSVHPDLALIVAGPRLKTPSQFSGQMYWSPEIPAQVAALRRAWKEDQKSVQNWEKSLPTGWQALANVDKRVWDRSVLFHEGLNADAIQSYLSKKAPHLPAIPTLNSCADVRRPSPFSWVLPAWSEARIRGALVLDLAWLQEPQLKGWFEEATKEARISVTL